MDIKKKLKESLSKQAGKFTAKSLLKGTKLANIIKKNKDRKS